MKKLIAMIVVIVIVVVLIKAFYTESSTPKEQISNKDDNVAKGWYEITEERVTFKDMLGVSLPDTVTDKHGYGDFTATVDKEAKKSFWIVATLPKEVFYSIVFELNFQKISDLLHFWPDAFSCQIEEFAVKYWDVENSVNDETYYGEHPRYRTQMVIKYENGKMYFKKEIIYIEAGTDDDGSTVYKKIDRSTTE